MEKIKKTARSWLEPAVIIVVILYVMDIQTDKLRTEIDGARTEIDSVRTEIDSVRTEIDSVQTELSLFREDVNRATARQDQDIRAADKKIDDLKNSLLSQKNKPYSKR